MGALAVVVAAATALSLADDLMAGFPDGHRTAYDRARLLPATGIAALSWCTCAYVVWLGTLGRRRATSKNAVVAVGALVVCVVLQFVCLRWFLLSVLGLAHGQGG